MISSHLLTGKTGEELAASYLQSKGYALLGKNVQTGRGEVDLIMRKQGVTVFVEVKTRLRKDNFSPSERVDAQKVRRLLGAADAWLQKQYARGSSEIPARIDVIGVAEGEVVEHFEDVTP